MDCIAENDDSYEVLVSHFPGKTKLIKKADWLLFQTWEQHISTGDIGLFSHTEIKDGPDGMTFPKKPLKKYK